MGICNTKGATGFDEESAFNQLEMSIHELRKKRQNMARHNEGVDVEERYNIISVLGQGSMGEVSIVSKKTDMKLHESFHSAAECYRKSFNSHRSNSTPRNFPSDPYRQSFVRSNSYESDTYSKMKMPSNPDLSAGLSERKYACKTINTVKMSFEEMKEFINEIDILRDLDHPNIVQLFEVFKVKRKIWLIMELCSGGDLTGRVKDMDEDRAAVVLQQILQAVAYMHTRNVCHRDIKLENIMFEDSSPSAVVKLIDFGLSNKFKKGEKMLKACGTVYTAAPELLLGNGYTEQTDIWSIGCVAFILLSKDYPFLKSFSDLEKVEKTAKLREARFSFGPSWKKRRVTKHGKEFVSFSLRKHPGSRWDVYNAFNHTHNVWIPYLEEHVLVQGDSIRSSYFDVNGDISKYKPGSPLDESKKAIGARVALTSDVLIGMVKFATYGEMKKTILMTMAYGMDKSTLKDVKQLFIALDTEGTGTLSYAELKSAIVSAPGAMHDLDEKQIAKLFHELDHDKSGQIHYIEFLASVSESCGLLTMELLAEAFDRIDSRGKGYITKDDIRDILGSDCNEDLVNKMIKEADFKKNGQVDYDEFLKLMFEDSSSGYEVDADAMGDHKSQ